MGSTHVDAASLYEHGTTYAQVGVDVTPAVVGDDQVAAALTGAGATWWAWAVPRWQPGLVQLLVGVVLAVRGSRARREAAARRRIDTAVAARG